MTRILLMRSSSTAILALLLVAASLAGQEAAASDSTSAGSPALDQATVYAAPDGDDAAGGTRAEPVHSLSRALDLAARTGRIVVRLADGEYSVDAGLTLGQGMTLLGGLERSTWSAAGPDRRSVLVPSAKFRKQGTLLSATTGAVTLSGIELRDGKGRAATLLSLAGTALAARDVSFLVQGEGTRTAFAASASTVTISDSLFTAEVAGTATLLAVSGGTMTITDCTFRGPAQAVDFACLSVTDAARVAVTGGTFDPGSGMKVRSIRAAGSSVTLENTRLTSGTGSLEAASVDLRGGRFLARNCDFAASVESVVPTCLIANGASVAIEASRMEVSGKTGAAGISMSGGNLSVRDSFLRGGTTAEYLYLIYAVAAEVSIEESVLAGGETSDLVAVLTRDSRLEVRTTTIAAGRGRLDACAIDAQGSGPVHVSTTVFASPAPSEGPAIIVRSPTKGLPKGLQVLSSCFGGWERLIGFDPMSGVRDVASIDALNALDGDPLGGSLDGCIAEDPSVTFRGDGDYRLSLESQCFAAGIGARFWGE
jgi:hypothetical protein